MSASTSFDSLFPTAAAILTEDGATANDTTTLNSILQVQDDPRFICLRNTFTSLDRALLSRDARINNITDEIDAVLADRNAARADLAQAQANLSLVQASHQAAMDQAQATHDTTVSDLQTRLAAAQAAANASTATDTTPFSSTPDPATAEALRRALQQVTELSVDKNNLQSANTSLTAVNATLQSTVTTLSQAIANGPTSAAAPRQRGENPKPFTGDERDSTKRHTEWLVFKGRLQNLWFDNPTYYATDLQRIIHLQGLLAGSAFLSTTAAMQNIRQHPNDTETWKWKTSDEFLTALDKDYIVSSLVSLAFGQLKKLKMEDKYSAFPDFITQFVQLANQANMVDHLRVHHLLAKLPKSLADPIATILKQPSESDFAGWIDVCRTLWTNQQNNTYRRDDVPVTSSSGSGPRFSGPPRGGVYVDNSDRMELDRMRLYSMKVTPMEKAYREEHRLCRRCGGSCDSGSKIGNRYR